MSKEALKLALAALEHEANIGNDDAYKLERDALKEALAQDALQALHDENKSLGLYEQEPVAWMDVDGNISDNNDHKCFPIPLYTTPAQRLFVGLTDDEIKEIVGPWGDTPIKGYTRKLFDQIEAKLKEKNT